MSALDEARRSIDRIDRQIADLFTERMAAASTVAAYKAEHGLPILDKDREEQVIRRNAALIDDEAIRAHYVTFQRGMMAVSRTYQAEILSGVRVAYCGVEGAFAHIAAKRIYPTEQTTSFHSFADAYRAAEDGTCHCAVLPIENSTAGEVGQVMDLLFSGPLYISAVYDLSIRHQLLALPGARLTDVRRVYSHPQALQQCDAFIRHYGLEPVACTNTAVAAKQVAEGGDRTVAAIASRETAALYGLEILRPNINETACNTTRFAVLTRAEERVTDEFGMRTMLFFSVSHHAGALAEAIRLIGRHGFNMVSIRSRSFKQLLWQYYFAVELDGNAYTPAGQAMLADLSACCDKLRVVGVYPNDRDIDAFEEDAL